MSSLATELPDVAALKFKPRNELLAIALGAWAGVKHGEGGPVPKNFGEVMIECASLLGIQGPAFPEAFLALSNTREFKKK